jgi:hypothetical protein
MSADSRLGALKLPITSLSPKISDGRVADDLSAVKLKMVALVVSFGCLIVSLHLTIMQDIGLHKFALFSSSPVR